VTANISYSAYYKRRPHFLQNPFQLQRPFLSSPMRGAVAKPSYLKEQTRLKRRNVTTLVDSPGGLVFLRNDNLETGRRCVVGSTALSVKMIILRGVMTSLASG
jgi:hypothetical protein